MAHNLKETQARILATMKEKRISYGALSEKTGFSKSTLSRYFTQENIRFPINRLEVIAQALGVSATYLMGWDDDPQPHRIRKSMSLEEFANEFDIDFDRLEEVFSVASHWKNEIGVFDFSETETEELISYAKYLKSKRRRDK